MPYDSIRTSDGSNESVFKSVTATFRTPSGGIEKILLDVKIGNTSSEPLPVTLTGVAASFTVPTIANVSVPLANTEVAYALPANSRQLTVRCRGKARTQLAFAATESATNFITLPPGTTLSLFDLNTSGVTIYVQCPLASQTIEVLTWT